MKPPRKPRRDTSAPSATPKSAKPASSQSLSGNQRLNKLLAGAGFGSRRQVDELIEQGRVEVDGVVCDQLGMKVDASTAKITVDGTALKKFRPVYFALNKPAGVLCTNRDPQGRRRAIDFVPDSHRLFPVGRLDASSVGLLLLTNDGELTQQLTHPKHGVPKTYQVMVAGQVTADELRRLRRGIHLAEGYARVENVRLRNVRKNSTELEITLTEGKNREIRRVLARIGHKVVWLRRISIGPLRLGDLPEGAYRPLTHEEIASLYRAAEEARRARQAKKRAAPSEGARSDRKASEKKRPAFDDSSELPSQPISSTFDLSTSSTAPRDPFAWDDDDELLRANPFAPISEDDSDDFDEDDDEGYEGEGERRPLIDEDSDEGDSLGLPGIDDQDLWLVDDRSTRPAGKIIDYDESSPRPPKDRSGSPMRNSDRPSRKKVARGRSGTGPRRLSRSNERGTDSTDRPSGARGKRSTGRGSKSSGPARPKGKFASRKKSVGKRAASDRPVPGGRRAKKSASRPSSRPPRGKRRG